MGNRRKFRRYLAIALSTLVFATTSMSNVVLAAETQVSEEPIQPAALEEEPVTPPAEPTTLPEEPTTPPAEPTTPPAEPTTPPAEPTTLPEEPTTLPAEPTTPPTEPTTPSAEPTTPPTEPTEPSVEPTTPPTEPTEPSTEPAEEPEEPKMPAFEGEYVNSEVRISVSAPENVLPEGVELVVTPIVRRDTSNMSAAEAAEAEKINAQYDAIEAKLTAEAAKAEGDALQGVLAYDISFWAEGEEIEPEGNVNVEFNFAQAVRPEGRFTKLDVAVHHFKEEAAGTIVEDITNISNVEMVEETKAVEQVEFLADNFSAYTVSWLGREGDTTPGTTTVTVTKKWEEEEKYSDLNLIPASLQVELYRKDTDVLVSTATLYPENGWTYTWTNLTAGIEYEVREIVPAGFEKEPEITFNNDVAIAEGYEKVPSCANLVYDIGYNNMLYTRTTEQEGIFWTVEDLGLEDKVDAIGETLDGAMKAKKYTYIHGAAALNGVSVTPIANGWQLSFTKQSVWTMFWHMRYNWEVKPEILNKADQTVSLTVNKAWIGDDEETRPENITVQLYKDGEEYKEPAVLTAPDWTYTFTDLPRYKEVNGKYQKCVYTVKEIKIGEEPVEDGKGGDYKVSVSPVVEGTDGNMDYTITITNAMGIGALTITKIIDNMSEVDFYDGDPVFTFKITNVSEGIELYRTVRFTQGDGSTKTIEIDNLPIGEYVIEELDTLRYSCDAKIQTAEIVNKDDVPNVTFHNTLFYDRNFSHTDVVENSFTISADGTVNVSKNLVHGTAVPGAAQESQGGTQDVPANAGNSLVKNVQEGIPQKMQKYIDRVEKEGK